MKALKLSLVIMAAALVTISLSGMAYAFHDGGVANCESCHTIHNFLDSNPNSTMTHKSTYNSTTGTYTTSYTGTPLTGNSFLLQGSDPSSTCLNCHANKSASGIAIMTYGPTIGPGSPPLQRTPGGDFGWMAANYNASGKTGNGPTNHGHNIVAQDYGLPFAAAPNTYAPGGSYLSTSLYCTSCHNPHSNTRAVCNPGTAGPTSSCFVTSGLTKSVPPIIGSGSYGAVGTSTGAVGVYRLLGSQGYWPMSYGNTSVAFVNPAPVAVAPSSWNQTEASSDVRVAYGMGMSEWCANCHLQIYNNGKSSYSTGSSGGGYTTTGGSHIHPAFQGALLIAMANMSGNTSNSYAAIYNAYVTTGNLTGSQSNSYTSFVPYEEGTGDVSSAGLAAAGHVGANAYKSGPCAGPGPTTGNENVMCLTCHRAHASGFPQGTRWNMAEYVTSGTGYSISSSSTMGQTDYQAAMYDQAYTLYGTYQRSLCNKCHAKD